MGLPENVSESVGVVMSQQTGLVYEFDSFRIDAVKRLLLREGDPLAVTSKVFDLLLILIARSGQVVQKDELIRILWPDTAVEENNLTQHVSMLRRALGERAAEHRYIVTVPGRGYSFVADVRVVESSLESMPEQARWRVETEKKDRAWSLSDDEHLCSCGLRLRSCDDRDLRLLAHRQQSGSRHCKDEIDRDTSFQIAHRGK